MEMETYILNGEQEINLDNFTLIFILIYLILFKTFDFQNVGYISEST